jgi:CHAP domain-containing protein
MATAQDVLRIAAGEIGTTEQPVNRQKYSTAVGRPAESWCADFAEWVLRQVGIVPPVNTWGNASTLVRCWGPIQQMPQPGDLVGYHFAGEAAGIDHVGIVESVDTIHGTITSIEGNTSSGVAGSQSNGGGVYRRVRPFSQVVGFGRPPYSAPKETPMADAMPDYPVTAAPISITVLGDGSGYIILCADGGVFCFGAAKYLGRVHKA